MKFEEFEEKDEYEEAKYNFLPPPKWWVVTKKVIKYFFFSLLTLVWVAIIGVLILRSDDDIYETPVLSDSARQIFLEDEASFEAYRVYPTVFMNDDGSIQLSEAIYSAKANEFEIGVRIAWSQLRYCEVCKRIYTVPELEEQQKQDEDNQENELYKPKSCTLLHPDSVKRASKVSGLSLSYLITDSHDNEYTVSNFVNRTKSILPKIFLIKYEYARVSFSGIYFNIGNNIINTVGTDVDTDSLPDVSFVFHIYDESSGNEIFSTRVYNNGTYLTEYKYELPDSEYLK